MADFVFAPGAEPGDFRAGGYGWKLNWMGGRASHRSIEAARLGINAANEAAAEQARNVHDWQDDTYQTRESVFVRPAHYNLRTKQLWGSWGVRDLPREPGRVGGPSENYPQYEGKILTTKDVALLLEFGFHTRSGQERQYPWLYPAWDAERGTVLARVKVAYKGLPANFVYRMGGTGWVMSIEQVYGPNRLGGPNNPGIGM